MLRKIIIAATAVISLAGSAVAFDLETGRGIGQGRTLSLHYSSPSELLTLPSGSFTPGEWGFQTGFSRPYELSQLDQLFIVGAYRYEFATAALGFSQFGENNLYTEKKARLAVSVTRGPFTISTMFSAVLVEVGEDYEDLNAATFGFGAAFRSERVYAGASVDDINSPRLYETAIPYNPKYNLYTEVVGYSSFSLTGRLTLEKQQKPQLALGQRIALADRSYFFWGISTEPLEYGAGVDIFVSPVTFTYAVRNHPALGYSHTVSISVGGGGRVRREGSGEFD